MLCVDFYRWWGYHAEMDDLKVRPFSLEDAEKVTRTWINSHLPKPKSGYSQIQTLMQALGGRCVSETLNRGGDRDALCDLLADAWDILSRTWNAVTPSKHGSSAWQTLLTIERNGGPFMQEEKLKLENAKHLLWKRHDPLISFNDGTTSEHYVAVDQEELSNAVISYLERPYLRLPELDWLFLDISVTGEICAYGESIKMRLIPGDSFLGLNLNYSSSAGKLSTMIQKSRNKLSYKIKYLFSFIISLSAKAFDPLRWFLKKTPVEKTQWEKEVGLWNQMRQVWLRLKGPLVHPTRVRDAMIESSKEGAVWSNISWALIDRTIACDPAVWVVWK